MNVLTKNLLGWYRKNRILYPWRKTREPYNVWLSEILLQQTRISVVLRFYEKILKRYPDLKDLARASDSDFLALWSGIGYYRRGYNMLSCAREIMKNHGGAFPSDLSALLQLPGIGKYTAGAIRNIAFEIFTPAIDANIHRVLSRLTLSEKNLNESFVFMGKDAPPSDFFQALMELGERICLPDPDCMHCPVRRSCMARKEGVQSEFPAKKARKETEVVHWYLLVLDSKSRSYYVQNKARAFLKNAWIFPDLMLRREITDQRLIREFRNLWGIKIGAIQTHHVIRHTVTFRKIHAHVLVPKSHRLNGSKGLWLSPAELEKYPTSSITGKVLKLDTEAQRHRG